ncbi:OsmC family protein [Henriciella mobilis]|uniref:bifunctional alpha/beta hydrolase/OsmC family protein n=1 Tax=Henriciella mobilis TaxID=2305467 RepID=UPI000E662B74|nr:bifunctional alpha/beta hydrolase/OsmC family protein [Henriciella mobilis]RIJ14425.1 OsmC family protein [Henriciella mobilis]RIJ19747.1 OsmC family protein [Henriciella mobilis]
MHSETVRFEGADGQTLVGRIDHPVGDVRGWAIFAHCFTCSKQSRAALRVSKGLAERGIGVLRFDFTGLGESDGDFETTNFSSNVADLVAAAGWMASKGCGPSLLVGHSLGGAAVIVAASQIDSIKAAATINAPSDAEHVIHNFADSLADIEAKGQAEVSLGNRPFTITRQFVEDVRASHVTNALRSLRLPLLFLHAPTDNVVGIDNATGLFMAARHPKSFVSLDDADHFLSNPDDAAFAASVIAAWANRYIDGPANDGDLIDQTHDVIVRETGEAGPYQNEVFINGRRYLADEPEDVGGSDTGPDPYEWVTTGLGACTSMTLRMYAAHKKWPLERVTVRLNHEKSHREDCKTCGPKDKIDVFTRDIEIEGALDEEQVARLKEIANRCPVHRTLEGELEVRTQISLSSGKKSNENA